MNKFTARLLQLLTILLPLAGLQAVEIDGNWVVETLLGQGSWHTAAAGCSATALRSPTALHLADNSLFVCDSGNNRVLIVTNFEARLTAPLRADIVIGQPDLVSSMAGCTATALRNPSAVCTDGSRLLIYDSGNSRVLLYNTIPLRNGAAADVVIGQPDFTTGTAGCDRDRLAAGYGLSIHRGSLYIADSANNRILFYQTLPSSNGAAADSVLGQPDFTSNDSGRSRFALHAPHGLAVSDEAVFVTDRQNFRMLLFPLLPAAPPVAALAVFGQHNFTERGNALNGFYMTYPVAVALQAGELFLLDSSKSRLTCYQLDTDLTKPHSPQLVLGQPDFRDRATGCSPFKMNHPGGLAVSTTPGGNIRLAVADTQNNRVVVSQLNQRPLLASLPDRTIRPGTIIEFTPDVFDTPNDRERLHFQLESSTAGVTLDPRTGRFTWYPAETDRGLHYFTLSVSDTVQSSSNSFSLLVTDQPCHLAMLDANTKVERERLYPDTEILLEAAAHEHEPFQLVLRPASDLKKAAVTVSPFVGSNGLTENRPEIVATYEVQYTTLTNFSALAEDMVTALVDAEFKKQELADPLWPLDPAERRNYTAHRNHTLWYDLMVPRGTPPGIYRATLRLDADGMPPQEKIIRLRVHNFTLPETKRLLACYSWSPMFMAQAHGIPDRSPDMQRLFELYCRDAAARYLTPMFYNHAFTFNWPTYTYLCNGAPFSSGGEVTSGTFSRLKYASDTRQELSISNETATQTGRFVFETIPSADHRNTQLTLHLEYLSSGNATNIAIEHFPFIYRYRTDAATRTIQLPEADDWRTVESEFTPTADLHCISLLLQGGPASVQWRNISVRAGAETIWQADTSGTNLVVLNPGLADELKHYLDTIRLPAFNFGLGHGYGIRMTGEPFAPSTERLQTSYWEQIYPLILQNGWLDRAFAVALDEADNRDLVAFYYQSIKKAAPLLPVMVSGLTPRRYATYHQYGDIWNVYQYSTNYNRGLARGERFIQNFVPRPDETAFENRRIAAFLWRSGFTGLLAWSTTYWPANPWLEPNQLAPGGKTRYGPGNGFLYYPPDRNYAVGTVARDNFMIVPSIRLELLRESIEDYEYFALLQQLHDTLPQGEQRQAAALLQELQQLVVLHEHPRPHEYKYSLTSWRNLRHRIAVLLSR